MPLIRRLIALLALPVIALLPSGGIGSEPAAAGSFPLERELWLPPLGDPIRVSTPFSMPNGPYRAGHRGIDLLTRVGDRLRSPAAGTVSFSGTVVDRPVLSIRIDSRTVISLEPVETDLREGDAVGRGEIIGTVAAGPVAGDHCATTCVHFGVRVDGAYVNPLRFLRPRPELLPW